MWIGQRFKYKFPSPCPPGRIWKINPFCSEEDLHSCSHFAGDFVCVTLGTADCSTLVHPSILPDKLSHPYRSVQAFPLLCLPHLQLSPLPHPVARTKTFITLDDSTWAGALVLSWFAIGMQPGPYPITSSLTSPPLTESPADLSRGLCLLSVFPMPHFSLNPGFGFQNS